MNVTTENNITTKLFTFKIKVLRITRIRYIFVIISQFSEIMIGEILHNVDIYQMIHFYIYFMSLQNHRQEFLYRYL